MNMLIAPGEGYIPEYTRTDLTDKLHDTFGFRTDFPALIPYWPPGLKENILQFSSTYPFFYNKKDSLRKDSSLFFQKYHFTLLSEI